MKKKVIYFSIFTIIVFISYFLISSVFHSNLRFKIYHANLENYSGEDKQDFFLNYYLTSDDNIIYFDYRAKNTIMKKLDTKTGEKSVLISLKEYGSYNISFSFTESLDYYNILSDSRMLRYNKQTYQIEQISIDNSYHYLFETNSNNYYMVNENSFFDMNKNLLFTTTFSIDKCSYLKNQVFFATSFDNEAYIIDTKNNKSIKIGTYYINYCFDENGVYLTSRNDNKIKVSAFNLTGNLVHSFSLNQFSIYTNFTRNGYIYYLTKEDNAGKLRIVNVKNQKISEIVLISKQENTIINFDNLLICSTNRLYLGSRTTEFDFNLDEQKTTQKLLYFN